MATKSHARGHEIEYINNQWVYSDTKEPINNNERACKKCSCYPTEEGHDACLGYIEGVTSACCGHGVGEEIMMYE